MQYVIQRLIFGMKYECESEKTFIVNSVVCICMNEIYHGERGYSNIVKEIREKRGESEKRGQLGQREERDGVI